MLHMTLPADGSLVPVSLYRAVRVLHQQGGTGADEVIEMGHGMTPRRHDCDDVVHVAPHFAGRILSPLAAVRFLAGLRRAKPRCGFYCQRVPN